MSEANDYSEWQTGEQLAMDVGSPVDRGPAGLSWQFADCLPDRIHPTNIDFFIELEGNFLYGEFKPPNSKIKEGQLRAFLALSKQPRTTFFLVEYQEPCKVLRWRAFCNGRVMEWEVGDLDALKGKVRAWAFRVAPHRCWS